MVIHKKRKTTLTAFLLLISSVLIGSSQISNTRTDYNIQPALTDYIDIYQKYISSALGSSCVMHPSCSNYGMGAFKTYHPLKAAVLTSDRLLRCSHDYKHYDKTMTSGGVKLMDLPKEDYRKSSEIKKIKSKYLLYNELDTTEHGAFVNYLISKKYYREALLELNRLMFHDQKNMSKYQYSNYLICKRALNEHEEAIYAFEMFFPSQIQQIPLITHEVGNLNFELSNYNKALQFYDKCLNNTSNPTLSDKSIIMKGLVLANQRKWMESKQMFLSLSDSGIYKYTKENLLTIVNKGEKQDYKKPYVAGILSIVPGLGYAYAGHKQTAISSLVINSLLAYATYTSYKNENYGMSALVSLFSISFYIGNISGSVKSVRRYNRKKEQIVIDELKSNIHY